MGSLSNANKIHEITRSNPNKYLVWFVDRSFLLHETRRKAFGQLDDLPVCLALWQLSSLRNGNLASGDVVIAVFYR